MRSFLNKAVAIALATVTAFSLVACKSGSPESESGSSGVNAPASTQVWTATSSEKFLRETDYSPMYSRKTFEVKAFRNEEEAGQIIITAAEDTTYTFEVANLISQSGDVLEKSAFTVYNEKYIYLSTIKDALNSQGAGYYPDALLPYEKAVEYNENRVSNGCNQGIYIVVKPSKEQKAGVYTGNFKLTLNGKEQDVAAKVTVYDYTLTDETHMKTSFSIPKKDLAILELDSSAEMAYTYSDFFASKRLSGGIPLTDDWSFDRKMYFDYVEKRIDDPKTSAIFATFTGGATAVRTTTIDGVTTLAIDENINDSNEITSIPTAAWDSVQPLYEQYFTESFARGKNMYQKMVMYLSIIDEFDSGSDVSYGVLKATYNLRRTEDMFLRIADLIETLEYQDGKVICKYTVKFDSANDNGGYGYYLSPIIPTEDGSVKYKEYECNVSEDSFEDFKTEVANGAREVTNVVTATQIYDFIYENQNFASFCPTIEKIIPVINLHRDYAQKAGREMWTYTAVNPTAPYPTYHLDDALISSRLLGTIMYENDIVGNLFWATGLSRIVDGNDAQLAGQDFYQEPLRFTGANGDGFLLYPGRPYGINGPVTCMRMESIRDSVEDYDLLYELENYYYKKHGATSAGFDALLKFATEKLYNGARINYDDGYIDNFLAARDLIASLLELAANNDTAITDYAFSDGKARFTVSAPKDAEIYVGGVKQTGAVNGEYVVYNIALTLDKSENFLELKSVLGGKAYEVTIALGGKSEGLSNSDLKSYLTVTNDVAEITADEESVKVAFEAKGDRTTARVKFSASTLKIGAEYESVTLKIYNPSGKRVRLSVTGRSKASFAGMTVDFGELSEGWNEITLPLSSFGVKDGDDLDYLNFVLNPIDGASLSEAFDLFIKDLTLKGA